MLGCDGWDWSGEEEKMGEEVLELKVRKVSTWSRPTLLLYQDYL